LPAAIVQRHDLALSIGGLTATRALSRRNRRPGGSIPYLRMSGATSWMRDVARKRIALARPKGTNLRGGARIGAFALHIQSQRTVGWLAVHSGGTPRFCNVGGAILGTAGTMMRQRSSAAHGRGRLAMNAKRRSTAPIVTKPIAQGDRAPYPAGRKDLP